MIPRHDVCVVIPVYNEVQVIADVICTVRRLYPNVVCVDDGSSDGSAGAGVDAGLAAPEPAAVEALEASREQTVTACEALVRLYGRVGLWAKAVDALQRETELTSDAGQVRALSHVAVGRQLQPVSDLERPRAFPDIGVPSTLPDLLTGRASPACAHA